MVWLGCLDIEANDTQEKDTEQTIYLRMELKRKLKKNDFSKE
jgi:hypothetical protein